jgi:hypothetical protein
LQVRFSFPLGTGRNVAIDNWFTSYELAIRVLTNHRLTIVGTMKEINARYHPAFSTLETER